MSCKVAYVADPLAIAQTVYELIELARESIVLQMYLLCANGHTITLRPRPGVFPYAQTVADWLIARKQRCPDLAIVVLLDTNTPDDPGQTRHGGDLVRHQLERAGIPVLDANLFTTRFDRNRRFPPRRRPAPPLEAPRPPRLGRPPAPLAGFAQRRGPPQEPRRGPG